MMVYIVIFILLINTIFMYLKYRDVFHPVWIFSFFWLIIVFLSSLNLYGLYKPIDKIYFIIVVGVVSTTVGNIIIPSYNKKSSTRRVKVNVNNKIIPILILFSVIWGINSLINTLSLLNQGYSLSTIRFINFNSEFFDSEITGISRSSKFIDAYFHLPIVYISSAYLNALILKNKVKNNKSIVILVLLNIALYSFNTGGRVLLYILVVQLIISFLILNKKLILKLSFKSIVFYLILIVCSIYFANFITESRSGSNGVIRSIYIYFAGSLSHASVVDSSIKIESSYGMNFLSGFIQPISMVLKNILNLEYPNTLNIVLNNFAILQEVRVIGENVTYNAFVTMFYYFYIDFSYIGVIIFSLIFGFFISYTYNKMKKNYNLTSIMIYFIIIQSIITSMVRWQYSVLSFSMVFYYILISDLLSRVKIK